MAWDFSTEPDFERKLDWIRDFVRTEIYPLEVLDLDQHEFRALASVACRKLFYGVIGGTMEHVLCSCPGAARG